MGKGQFIMGLASNNPDINYIGIEKYSSVLVRALDKRENLETDNLMFLRMDAEDIRILQNILPLKKFQEFT